MREKRGPSGAHVHVLPQDARRTNLLGRSFRASARRVSAMTRSPCGDPGPGVPPRVTVIGWLASGIFHRFGSRTPLPGRK